jgi:hypothetical protein
MMSDQPPNDEDKQDDLADLLAALDEVTKKEKTGELPAVDASAPDDAPTDDAVPDEPPQDDAEPERAHMSYGARDRPATPSGETGEFSTERPTVPRQTGPAIRVTPPTPARTTSTPEAIKFRYRIAVVLSPQLELQLNAARQSVSIPVARPGIFALQEDFESSDIDSVQTVIKSWAAEHLPLEVEVERVVAEVSGEQRYLTGFALEPAQKLNAAQQALATSLANNIRPVGEGALPFAPRLPVSDHTPAADFPRLVHELQKRFEATEWVIEAVELLRVPEGDDRWEVVQKF